MKLLELPPEILFNVLDSLDLPTLTRFYRTQHNTSALIESYLLTAITTPRIDIPQDLPLIQLFGLYEFYRSYYQLNIAHCITEVCQSAENIYTKSHWTEEAKPLIKKINALNTANGKDNLLENLFCCRVELIKSGIYINPQLNDSHQKTIKQLLELPTLIEAATMLGFNSWVDFLLIRQNPTENLARLAIQYNRETIYTLLIKTGLGTEKKICFYMINEKFKLSPLHLAIINNATDIVKILVKSGATLNEESTLIKADDINKPEKYSATVRELLDPTALTDEMKRLVDPENQLKASQECLSKKTELRAEYFNHSFFKKPEPVPSIDEYQTKANQQDLRLSASSDD